MCVFSIYIAVLKSKRVRSSSPSAYPCGLHCRRTVKAFGALAQAAKQVSGGKAFTAFYYGYLYELAGHRLAGSGHLAVGELMQEPAIDGALCWGSFPQYCMGNSILFKEQIRVIRVV